MDIRALGVLEVAEEALGGRGSGRSSSPSQQFSMIAQWRWVFSDMSARSPAFVHGHRGRDLDEDVLAVLHGLEGHRDVPLHGVET
jgi:hypothetical protein